MYKLSQKSKQNRDGVDKRLIEVSNLAIKITTVDFGIPSTGGIRTAKKQNKLFLDGKSRCDGYEKISNHQRGKALDFYAYVNGQANWQTKYLSIVAAAHLQAASMLGYKLKWGGFFNSFKDYPHVELIE